ncbi:SAM-dependent chlorinase/fluorinase [Blastopirellula sp. JC732]|uniref:SAM-dependent chlorinase/fluorinase n=1 Tax=Blastopirellula sediminis TaxID=2894196 RepID=A0A9X1SJE5_9BACT|nr:SAM-dependent chlorinase/fluorinase [Blastopirellula sediminis]MCC9604845.1 SAM-dependent chlorinase/fluorinase [Blastopirellula sediminis]MCC9631856.1 SAM-dependent chlorinase/fluorinase [Blastopirellula sediminis]
MTSGIITLLTDFGADSPYVAEMKGAILAVSRLATIVDLTHSVAPQNIRQGAYLLDRTYRSFPYGTVHVAVVDPGVGSQRKIIAAEINGQIFVLPDNGLLSVVAASGEATQLREVANPKLWRQTVSATFHGRDVMGPVGAYLAAGGLWDEVGPPTSEIARFELPAVSRKAGLIDGEVIYADSFGNLVTNITRNDLESVEILSIEIDGRPVGPLSSTYSEQNTGSPIALIGSSGQLEISIVSGSASAWLGGSFAGKVKIEVKS